MKDIPAVVVLSPSAFGVMQAELDASPAGIETGGILLGHQYEEGILISTAGDPGPNAIRESSHFQRDLAHAQDLADEAWVREASVWLGEWHSHPGSGLAPSEFDVRTYRTHLRDPQLAFEVFLSVIVRQAKPGLRLVAWAITLEEIFRIPLRF